MYQSKMNFNRPNQRHKLNLSINSHPRAILRAIEKREALPRGYLKELVETARRPKHKLEAHEHFPLILEFLAQARVECFTYKEMSEASGIDSSRIANLCTIYAIPAPPKIEPKFHPRRGRRVPSKPRQI